MVAHRLLVTGLNGTLAPRLAVAARAAGHEVIGWNRQAAAPEDAAACLSWLGACRPTAIAHLGMGPEAWAGLLARHAAERGLPFVFTSTAMVFDHEPDGPHRAGDARTAHDDYGRYKIRCEDTILTASGSAAIVRIGWQIHAEPDGSARGNNMLAALDAQQAREGRIAASRAWRPACSFMDDTATALLGLLVSPQPGVHHVDSNAAEGHTFADVVLALARRFARTWVVQEHEDYRHDQRLVGGTLPVPPLSRHLPLPAAPGY